MLSYDVTWRSTWRVHLIVFHLLVGVPSPLRKSLSNSCGSSWHLIRSSSSNFFGNSLSNAFLTWSCNDFGHFFGIWIGPLRFFSIFYKESSNTSFKAVIGNLIGNCFDNYFFRNKFGFVLAMSSASVVATEVFYQSF